MPGIAYHLYFGKRTMEELCQKDIQLDSDYLLGNILPDFAKNKESAHHYPDSSNNFFVPNLEAAIQRYSHIVNPSLRYGILAHLYLDKCFTEKFITPRFKYDPRFEIVTKLDADSRWTLQDFFSYRGLYHAYSEINPLMFENNLLDLDWLSQNIPHQLPIASLAALDDHTTNDWYEFLTQRLVNPPKYTGELFAYDELIKFLDQTINDFVTQDYLALFSPPQDHYAPQPEVDSTDSEWDRFRQGVTDILLGVPYPECRQLVFHTIDELCKEYQTYRIFCNNSSHTSCVSCNYTGAINDIALIGARELHAQTDTLRLRALDEIYRPNSIDEFKQLREKFTACNERYCYRFKEKRISLITSLFKGLAAVDGEFYRLIVSYSNF